MSIQNAINLLNAIDNEPNLRMQMYSCFGSDEVLDYLKAKGFSFSFSELEDAVNYKHVQCQTIEEAQELLHKADWLKFQISIK
jgi:predicted ribosomally synthesized peptide with nif11-like leader